MKFPAKPPDPAAVLAAAAGKGAETLTDLMRQARIVDGKGRYLHWDDLRFKKPPSGFSSEQWWAATRMARRAASQPTPLLDIANVGFAFCEPPRLKSVLNRLDMNSGGALASDATALSKVEGAMYLTRSLAEEPFASSFIEGAATTRKIAKKLIFEERQPRTKDERMVLNNYRAMLFVKQHADDELSIPLLLELHRIVTEQTLDDPNDAGRIRRSDDVRVVDDSTGEVLFQPPPAAELRVRLGRLIEFANAVPDARNWIHPLLRAFILHFMLSYEHPFVDGNGRVARALFYWAALKSGYWLMEYVSISSVIAESKISYGRAFLHTETDNADLTYFLVYHANILDTAISRLLEYADRKRNEVAAFEKRIADRHRHDAFNHRQSWLLNEFARGRLERVTVDEHKRRNAVSYLTARKDLESLTAAKYLLRRKNGKTIEYRPVQNLIGILTR
ncbi:MAG TPA: Fic family protein [Rhizomicrobium sp.]|nr:Fic family protein [Rhizomicrobium sp.]